jgi:hypothetical protein
VSTSILLALLACKKEDPGPGVDPTTPPTTDTTPTVDTFVTDTEVPDTSPPVDTSVEPPIDCATLTNEPVATRELGRPRAHHGLAFDLDGYIIGLDDDNLIKVAYDNTFFPWAPGVGTTEQMDWLPDGDLVVARVSTASLIRINAAGASSVIAGDVPAYGVTVGPDGKIWAGTLSQLIRVDPTTGDKEVLFPDAPGSFDPRVIAFSPDVTKVYIGMFGNGEIYVADLDANFDPIGTPTLFAAGVGNGPYMDCMTVDACGNLYVCDYSTNNLYRISPTGQVGTFVDWSSTAYGHGVAWGSGIGGWSATAIYFPQPYDGDTVLEMELGVGSGEALWPPFP